MERKEAKNPGTLKWCLKRAEQAGIELQIIATLISTTLVKRRQHIHGVGK